MSVLAELRNRGMTDVLICCCDGLPGLADAITATWPQATVQTCCVHLMRASLRFASKKDYPQLVPALKAIYTAPTEVAAEQALTELEESPIGRRYPAIARTWRSAWPEFVPFLQFPPELRTSNTSAFQRRGSRLSRSRPDTALLDESNRKSSVTSFLHVRLLSLGRRNRLSHLDIPVARQDGDAQTSADTGSRDPPRTTRTTLWETQEREFLRLAKIGISSNIGPTGSCPTATGLQAPVMTDNNVWLSAG